MVEGQVLRGQVQTVRRRGLAIDAKNFVMGARRGIGVDEAGRRPPPRLAGPVQRVSGSVGRNAEVVFAVIPSGPAHIAKELIASRRDGVLGKTPSDGEQRGFVEMTTPASSVVGGEQNGVRSPSGAALEGGGAQP